MSKVRFESVIHLLYFIPVVVGYFRHNLDAVPDFVCSFLCVQGHVRPQWFPGPPVPPQLLEVLGEAPQAAQRHVLFKEHQHPERLPLRMRAHALILEHVPGVGELAQPVLDVPPPTLAPQIHVQPEVCNTKHTCHSIDVDSHIVLFISKTPNSLINGKKYEMICSQTMDMLRSNYHIDIETFSTNEL